MEPLDPAKNDESSGFSRRRISSILKAPRKSTIFPNPEQQENVVECPKPVEKRNSRRVSFAPANDVLLFSNDAKKASPTRSPLQDLMTTAAATKNRVQVGLTEDGIQQITGMETLLNAPLHTSQQRDKVNFDIGGDFGEKTVMFSTDDAFMDMTHSQTINIANDKETLADISLQNDDMLPTSGEKTVMFTAGDGSMDITQSHTANIASGIVALPTSRSKDLSVEKSSVNSSVPGLIPDFENFLANLFKPSVPSVNPMTTNMMRPAGASSEETNSSSAYIKTQRADVDKENQAPTSISAVMEKSRNTSRKIGESSYGCALYPKDDVSMDMTEKTGRIRGFTDAGDEFMDMTQSRTVNISSGSLALANQNRTCVKMDNASSLQERRRETCGPPSSSANSLEPGFKNFLPSIFKTSAPRGNPEIARVVPPAAASCQEIVNTNSYMSQHKTDVGKENRSLNTTICPANDMSMEMTEPQTGRIVGLSSSDGLFQFSHPTQDMYPRCESLKRAEMTSGEKNSKAPGPFNSAGLETSLKPSLKTNVRTHQVKCSAEDDGREKTVKFTADEACMDVTRSHTVNIVRDLEIRSHQNVDFLPACGEKTVRFTAHDADMDVTQCHTVNIATGFGQQSYHNVDYLPACGEKTVRFTANDAAMDVTQCHTVNISVGFDPQSHQNMDSLPACGEKTVRFNANEACMDMTQSHTVNIASDLKLHAKQNVNFVPAYGEKTDRFTANDTTMDVTQCLTANIATDIGPQSHHDVDCLPACGEKTVRFAAKEACMDMTQSHTVNIASDLKLHSKQNVNLVPACGEKTDRFTANDTTMDVTQCLTANIATDIGPQSHHDVDCLPACGEKTVRFAAKEACMDMTQSHTVNIATDLKLHSHQNVDFVPACGEKTRFTANKVAMDVTQCHTADIGSDLKLRSHQNMDSLPACGERTVRFDAKDAAMDVTQSHTVNIATDFDAQSHQNLDFLPSRREEAVKFSANDAAVDVVESRTVNNASDSITDAGLPDRDSNILPSHENMDFLFPLKKRRSETRYPHRNQSSSALTLDPGFKISLSKMTDPWANPVITKAAPAAPLETVDTSGFLDQPKPQEPDVDTANEAPGYVSAVMENPVNNTMVDCPKDNVMMAMIEAQTGQLLGQMHTDEPPLYSSTQSLYSNSDHLDKTEVTSQQSRVALETSILKGVEVTKHTDYLASNEADNRKEPEPRNQTSSPNAGDLVDAVPSRKSRRASFADLHSKIRRLSHMINTAPDTVATESCTAPLPPMEHDADKNAKDQTESLPVMEPEPEMGSENTEENTQARMEGEQPSTASTTPFNLKTVQLISRLSVGRFKAKLPDRSKPDNSKKVNSVVEHTRTMTVDVTDQPSNFDGDVSDIYDEELGSCEDMSEMLDVRSPQKTTEKMSPPREFDMDGPVEDNVFEEDLISAVHGKKRCLPVDENHTEDEKRMKPSTETATDFEMGSQSHLVECDGNKSTAPCVTTQTTDDSNSSQTASMRCEATFESTFKQSLFESQLEDYASDVQRKFDDGSVTVLEFFKLFNIDFVIHNPRQSVRPEKLLSDTDLTPMDLLKDRHINHPKQMVYETDVLALTEKVEGLKERKRDLDKPLTIVNKPLWEDMRNSSEKELKSFGAKLKERNNLFRKTSKVQSHEMKEALYSNLVQANLEEQRRLRGTIEEADEMLKSLDDCIHGLEAELAAVEEKGSEDTPSLKSRQEEMKKVTETLADNDRQISELEMQKNQSSKKLNRLKAETKNLDSHINMLHLVNEWKFAENGDNCTVYTFLHETFHLQLVYEESNGKDVDNQSERKISQISFKHQLDAEKSQDHACLVHKLLTQYVEGEAAWAEKYPTSRYVPKLLHDVGLVVGRCRLLGEELRLLKMWGGLRLDILNISCVDTQVHIVFSSLKKFSKFEVIFSVSLTNHLCVLQVESFKNVIGSTTIQQIEEIVASFSPGRNTLTKIVKKIHESLLC